MIPLYELSRNLAREVGCKSIWPNVMSRLASPLRYPGGKSCLLDITLQIIDYNDLGQKHYVEPYSGGCGLALSLLYEGYITYAHLNDADRAVWAFWHSALHHSDTLVSMVQNAELTVSEWERQRAVQTRGGLM